MTINRDKLKALSGDVLAEMARTDELEMCYVHLQSLNNLTPMAQRIAKAAERETAPAPVEPTAEGAAAETAPAEAAEGETVLSPAKRAERKSKNSRA
jgi:hypothetical protein